MSLRINQENPYFPSHIRAIDLIQINEPELKGLLSNQFNTLIDTFKLRERMLNGERLQAKFSNGFNGGVFLLTPQEEGPDYYNVYLAKGKHFLRFPYNLGKKEIPIVTDHNFDDGHTFSIGDFIPYTIGETLKETNKQGKLEWISVQ